MTLIETKARQHEQFYTNVHRKLLGTHYTPDSVVDYIVNRTLQPYVESPELLSTIKILDPACGSGLFLLKAYDVLADHWKKAFGRFTQKDALHIIENSLFGIDIDEQSVLATKRHLMQKASFVDVSPYKIAPNIVVGDALYLRPFSKLMQLDEQVAFMSRFGPNFSKHKFHCIVGNPPYIRTQNIPKEKRDYYSTVYSTAAGRFDISGLFIELSEYLLKEKGRLGFIISNKILSTSGAKKLRSFLINHFSIEEIVDLSDTKIFDAAILPLILIATRSKEILKHITYSLITESYKNIDSKHQTTDLLTLLKDSSIPLDTHVTVNGRGFQVQRFTTVTPSERSNVWTFHNERENTLLTKLRYQSTCTLGELCEKISVGLKTTADNVFIKPMVGDFIKQLELEEKLIYPLLESHNVNRWRCSWNSQTDLCVLYPYTEQKGKVVPIDLNKYPRTKEYLEKNRKQLEARTYLKESQRQWYEIWVHQSPKDFCQLKIVTPDIAKHNRFALDDRGFFVNGTCFYLILKDKSYISYYSMLGLLNSKVIEYFHKITSGNSLYAKRFRYWTSYISTYPIPKYFINSPQIISIMANNVSRLFNNPTDEEQINLEKENELLCCKLFDLTDSDIQEIDTTLAIQRSCKH